MRSIRMKQFSDITNYQTPPPPLNFDLILPLTPSSSSSKQQFHHLLKEHAEMMKLISDQNKIIEMNRVELQKMRIFVQKTQSQNWKLAQSNSCMMEFTIGRKKLTVLEHQLGCKDALFKAMRFDLQMKDFENTPINRQNTNRRIRPVRSQSIGHMTTVQASEEEIVENKRRCVRRQTVGFTSQEDEFNENLFEIKDLNVHEYYSPTSKTITQQKHEKCGLKPKQQQESQRISFGRPPRKAADKIHTYKETPLNVKMRRPQ
ncbi:uncharacterized protein LOC143533529 [Bidens hawaiensis]|uniref:uncharacterized protein LOC143533529 n=1 Tax=Bidens hawaiensis TaxID=980011 RepID=UPI00404AD610